MAENTSLADRAVEALAEVRKMGDGLGLGHPERHAVNRLKRVAEQIISNALDTAIDLAWQAKDTSVLARKIEADKIIQATGAEKVE